MDDYNNLSKSAIRGSIAKARIDQNVRRINSMVHHIQPPSHDEVVLPKVNEKENKDDDDLSKFRSEDQKMRIRYYLIN